MATLEQDPIRVVLQQWPSNITEEHINKVLGHRKEAAQLVEEYNNLQKEAGRNKDIEFARYCKPVISHYNTQLKAANIVLGWMGYKNLPFTTIKDVNREILEAVLYYARLV